MKIKLPAPWKVEQLTAALGIHYTTLWKALCRTDPKTGARACTPDLAVRIHWFTGGAVPAWSLRPDLWAEGQTPPPPRGFQLPSPAERAAS
jgi:hypothetical protein